MGFDFTFRSLIDLTLVLGCGARGDPGSFSSLWLSVIPTGPIVRTFCFLLESPGTLDKNRRTACVTARPVPSALFCRAVRPPLCRRRVLAQLLSRSWNLLVSVPSQDCFHCSTFFAFPCRFYNQLISLFKKIVSGRQWHSRRICRSV